MVSVPVSVPTAVGAKLTVTVHPAPVSNVAGQSFVSEKTPVTEILISDSADVPEFVKATLLLAEVSIAWLGKLNEDADTAIEPVEEEELLRALDELGPAQPFSARKVLLSRSSSKREGLMHGHGVRMVSTSRYESWGSREHTLCPWSSTHTSVKVCPMVIRVTAQGMGCEPN
jgi:hypothetical protein